MSILYEDTSLNDDDKTRLRLFPGDILREVELPANSLGAIHINRVLHFFKPEEVLLFFKKSHKWLREGGMLYLVTMSPYHYALMGFDVEYKKRQEVGNLWPGEIFTMTKDYIPENKGKIPEYLNVMDNVVLKRELNKSGFEIVEMKIFGHKTKVNKHRDNNAGYIGIIAKKKK